ncbi:DUF6174 domain-containing protein [Nocardioides zeicaulis]|uniref:DUF6174 domain-containing protein n=1 Tax=Nocardioides zeicaulis TaxID=1776857 RepID=A0ABV6DWD9_9ACTN
MTGGLGAALALAVVAWTTFSPGLEARRAHHHAHALWEAREPAAYSFDYHECHGMCGDCRVRVTVRDGDVVEVATRPRSCGAYTTDTAPTIEGMFAIAADHHSTAGIDDVVDVSYDSLLGYPQHVSAICGFEASDCGSGWSISDFESVGER